MGGITKIRILKTVVERQEIVSRSAFRRSPGRDDVDVVAVDDVMAFQVAFVHFLFDEIDAPVFAVEEEDNRSRECGPHVERGGNLVSEPVVHAGRIGGVSERSEHQMLVFR